jgi:hypothetical protein
VRANTFQKLNLRLFLTPPPPPPPHLSLSLSLSPSFSPQTLRILKLGRLLKVFKIFGYIYIYNNILLHVITLYF